MNRPTIHRQENAPSIDTGRWPLSLIDPPKETVIRRLRRRRKSGKNRFSISFLMFTLIAEICDVEKRLIQACFLLPDIKLALNKGNICESLAIAGNNMWESALYENKVPRSERLPKTS
jgi:hypothetical protein